MHVPGRCPTGTTPAKGASCFVNPLTALGMVETMRTEGHTALVHTAAASNLGPDAQPHLPRRRRAARQHRAPREQAAILRDLGAEHIVDSSVADLPDDLTAALIATGATIAFDAIGGGPLAGQILGVHGGGGQRQGGEYSRYGSDVHKQVYIYGGLDRGPTELTRNFGMAWGVGGWLLTPFLGKLGLEGMLRLRQRVGRRARPPPSPATTPTRCPSPAPSTSPPSTYAKQATGQKFLIRPSD